VDSVACHRISQSQDAREIADAAWAQAALSKDVERMLSSYADNAMFLGIPGKVVTGREAFRELWKDFFSRTAYELSWKFEKAPVIG
jgi:uncharacterized protein (TIGR02246 family)